MDNQKQIEGLVVTLNPLSAYESQVQKGTEALSKITSITNKNECDAATDWLNKGKKLTKLIDNDVETICRPIKDLKAKADQMQRDVKAEAEKAKGQIPAECQRIEKLITDFVKTEKDRQQRELARQQMIQKRIEEVTIRGLVFDGLNTYTSIDGTISQDDILNPEFDFNSYITALQKTIDKRKKETEKKGEEFVLTGADEIPTYNAPIVTTMAPQVKGMQTYWKYEIINEEEIPRQYCDPSSVKINAAIKAGERNIAGLRIYSEDKIKQTKI